MSQKLEHNKWLSPKDPVKRSFLRRLVQKFGKEQVRAMRSAVASVKNETVDISINVWDKENGINHIIRKGSPEWEALKE